MQDIYKYKPETNHVCIVYIVAVFLKSQFPLHVLLMLMLNVLYLYISTSHSMYSAQYGCSLYFYYYYYYYHYYLLSPLYTWTGYLSRHSYCLRAGRSGDRIPVGARFSAPVQTGPETHPASCTMGTGSFPGVRCGRGVTLTPHPF